VGQELASFDVRELAESDMPEVCCPQDVLLPAHESFVPDVAFSIFLVHFLSALPPQADITEIRRADESEAG
jgi:hypothetical protein